MIFIYVYNDKGIVKCYVINKLPLYLQNLQSELSLHARKIHCQKLVSISCIFWSTINIRPIDSVIKLSQQKENSWYFVDVNVKIVKPYAPDNPWFNTANSFALGATSAGKFFINSVILTLDLDILEQRRTAKNLIFESSPVFVHF